MSVIYGIEMDIRINCNYSTDNMLINNKRLFFPYSKRITAYTLCQIEPTLCGSIQPDSLDTFSSSLTIEETVMPYC